MVNTKKKVRVAYVGATPAYYFIPFIRLLAQDSSVALTVHWLCDEAVRDFYEKDLGTIMNSESDLLTGYNYKFEKNLFGKQTYQNGFWSLNSIGPVVKILKGDYDVVIVHGWQYVTNIMVVLAAACRGVKILLRAETPLNQESNRPIFKKALRYLFLKTLFKLVNRYLFIGVQNYDFYKSFGVKSDHLFFAPYCIDNGKMKKMIAQGKALSNDTIKKYNFDANKRRLLFVGKMQRKKRPDFLIECFKNAKTKLNIELILIGAGELSPVLQKLAGERADIKLLGYLDQTEIAHVLAVSHAFVLPSGDGETWGLVLNEALNAALPLIVSDRVGSCDNLVTSANGVKFKLDDEKSLVDAIEEIFGNESRRISMGKESMKLTEIYSPENVKIGILDAINN